MKEESDIETSESLRQTLLEPSVPPSRTRSVDRLDQDGKVAEPNEATVKILATPSRRESQQTETEYLNDLDLPPDAFMEDVMTAIVQKKKLRRVTWQPTRNDDGHQILFSIENGNRCDDLIRLLSEWGVGEREGTSVSVLPCSLYHEPIIENKEAQQEE